MLKPFYENAKNGGRKSIPHKDFPKNLTIKIEGGMYLNYIRTLQYYLDQESSEYGIKDSE